MLYRNRAEFGAGHGVAVRWDLSPGDSQRACRLATASVRDHRSRACRAPAEDNPRLAGLVLDMTTWARLRTTSRGTWNPCRRHMRPGSPSGKRQCDPKAGLGWAHAGDAAAALARCRHSARRIGEGLALLARDRDAAEAFRFANRAMALQRVHTLAAEARARNAPANSPRSTFPPNRTWYPFQLAFILLNLPGLTQPHHPDRSRRPGGRRRPALVPHRRRQDRGLPGPDRLHAWPSAACRATVDGPVGRARAWPC